ncbi:hypothetical protein CRG98_009212 [Punica granatum]|uniref:Uncharacterized protein n=1 Tax=Punica granatum TaxID=22663 RepID=A0A2I0KPI9_PUNGR|nr:hypothetical protein CRG98_009212 [Punica granatum]
MGLPPHHRVLHFSPQCSAHTILAIVVLNQLIELPKRGLGLTTLFVTFEGRLKEDLLGEAPTPPISRYSSGGRQRFWWSMPTLVVANNLNWSNCGCHLSFTAQVQRQPPLIQLKSRSHKHPAGGVIVDVVKS